jgi:hypothetical protein
LVQNSSAIWLFSQYQNKTYLERMTSRREVMRAAELCGDGFSEPGRITSIGAGPIAQ